MQIVEHRVKHFGARMSELEGNPQMPPQAIDYQALADDYARHRRVHPGVLRRLLDTIAQTGARDVLEVGCGTGNYLEAIAGASDARVFGIDPSSAMLAQLHERMPDAEATVGRAESLPFPDRSLDLIYSVDVMHHVVERAAYFGEAARVLRPGGWICTVTDSHEDIAARVPLSSHFPETVAHELRRYPSLPTLRAETERAGFSGLREEHIDLRYPLTDASAYRNKAYSSLHLITGSEHARGIERMERELASGPIEARSLYTLLWGRAPGTASATL
jgi:SAM-dependent methyltransferase